MVIEGGINTEQPLARIISIQTEGAAFRAGGLKIGQLISHVDGYSLSGKNGILRATRQIHLRSVLSRAVARSNGSSDRRMLRQKGPKISDSGGERAKANARRVETILYATAVEEQDNLISKGKKNDFDDCFSP